MRSEQEMSCQRGKKRILECLGRVSKKLEVEAADAFVAGIKNFKHEPRVGGNVIEIECCPVDALLIRDGRGHANEIDIAGFQLIGVKPAKDLQAHMQVQQECVCILR